MNLWAVLDSPVIKTLECHSLKSKKVSLQCFDIQKNLIWMKEMGNCRAQRFIRREVTSYKIGILEWFLTKHFFPLQEVPTITYVSLEQTVWFRKQESPLNERDLLGSLDKSALKNCLDEKKREKSRKNKDNSVHKVRICKKKWVATSQQSFSQILHINVS